MDQKKKILLLYGLPGTFLGYCVFHRLVMLLSCLMTAGNSSPNLIRVTLSPM